MEPVTMKAEPQTQQVLFCGLDCLPGQMDLFATDGEEKIPQPPLITRRLIMRSKACVALDEDSSHFIEMARRGCFVGSSPAEQHACELSSAIVAFVGPLIIDLTIDLCRGAGTRSAPNPAAARMTRWHRLQSGAG